MGIKGQTPPRQGGAGQTIVEYIVLIGIITLALMAMGPLFKRGVQSLVKATADQIGNQQKADQDIIPRPLARTVPGTSYLVSESSNAESSVVKSVKTPGFGGVADIILKEDTQTNSEQVTDMGYTPR